MKLFKKNIKQMNILASKQYDVANLVKPSSVQTEILKSKTGEYYALYKGITIHSKYNPRKENIQIINKITTKAFDSLIIFGMGMGYLIEDIKKEFPRIPIYIIELDSKLFFDLLSSYDYVSHLGNSILKSLKIYLSPEHPDVIIQSLLENKFSKPLVINTRVAKQTINISTLSFYESQIAEYRQRITINHNSLKKYRNIWQKNIIKNLQSEHTFIDISHLKNQFSQYPILLCAGGPSVDNITPNLHQLKEKMIVVCVDTALNILYAHNIVPDFVVSVDPQFINSKHLDFCLKWACNNGAKLLIDGTASTKTLRSVPKTSPVYLSLSSQILCNILCDGTGVKNKLESGGSVTTFGLDFCRFLGARDIFTIGLDLSYPQKRSHARGTYFENLANTHYSRLSSSDYKSLLKFIQAPQKSLLKTYDNSEIYTDARLHEYKKWIEVYANKYKNLSIYTFSDQSCQIKGVKCVSLSKGLSHTSWRKTETVFPNSFSSPHIMNKSIIHKNIFELINNLIAIDSYLSNIITDNNFHGKDFYKIHTKKILEKKYADIILFYYQDILPSPEYANTEEFLILFSKACSQMLSLLIENSDISDDILGLNQTHKKRSVKEKLHTI